MKMRVVLFSNGFTLYTLELAHALSKTQKVVLFFSGKSATEFTLIPISEILRQYLNNNILIKRFNKKVSMKLLTNRKVENPKNIIEVVRFIKFIKKTSPDIIHTQSGYIWICLVLPFLRKCPLIVTVHDPYRHYGEKTLLAELVQNIFIKFAHRTIVHGKQMKKIMVEMHRIPSEKICVIPHGDFSIFKRWEKEDVIEEEHSILFFGRIWKYKGLEYLIKAEPIISREIPDIKIIIAGTGEDFKKYEDLMINREKFEVYNQFIPYEMVAELFQRASVVVLPYVEATQSGIIPIAYAFKKPVIATNVGSLPEVIENGKTGYVVPPRDAEKLAEAIIKLLKEPPLREEMGKNAYEKMMRELSWDRIADKTVEVYEEAMK